jgi:hypothetical protein
MEMALNIYPPLSPPCNSDLVFIVPKKAENIFWKIADGSENRKSQNML